MVFRPRLIVAFLSLAMLIAATSALARPATEPTPVAPAGVVASPADAVSSPAGDTPSLPASVATTDVVDELTRADATMEQPTDADEAVTAEDLAKQAQKIQQDWETLGWMGGTIGIIGFLLLLLRFKPINTLLGEHNLKRFKPYAAASLGALLGFFQCFITGKGWGISLVAGLIAGLATPGLHLLFTRGNTE